jgi:hypothetical protein
MSGHVAYVGEKTNSYRILLTRPAGRRPLENLDIDTVIILRHIVKKWDGRMWTEFRWLKTGTRGWLL